MDTHIDGSAYDAGVAGMSRGSVPCQRGFSITLSDNAVAKYLLTVDADTNRPVEVEANLFAEAAFYGAASELVIGSSTTPTLIANMTSISSTGIGFKSGGRALFRAKTAIYAILGTGTKASATFTPPTSGTATLVINGVSFLSTFNASATQTVTDLKALIAANSTISALISTSGTTTLVVTAKYAGTAGNAITITSNAANGASVTGSGFLASGANGTTGSGIITLKVVGIGTGSRIAV